MDELAVTDTIPPGLEAAQTAAFTAHAASLGHVSDFRPLAIPVIRDGAVVGGLRGRTGRGWLCVTHLALPETERGNGLGRRLMALAEAEAIRRGCHGAFLDTIAFQAPGFYQKLGYTEIGRLCDDDPRLDRIWFSKRFAP